MKKLSLKASLFTGVLAAFSGAPTTASAALVLPEVEACGTAIQTALSGGLNNLQCLKGTVTGNTATTSGTYIASYHDEFLSYSIEALETIQKENESMLLISEYGDWSKLVSGSGQLDIGVLIKASGGGVLNNDDPFPDAQDSNTSDPIYVRTWGGNTGTDTNDPGVDPNDPILTVSEVVAWLNPEKIPVFYFDLADPQSQTNADMFFIGQIYITNADGSQVLDTWAMDNNFNGAYDGTQQTASNDPYAVLAPKNVPVYIPGSGCTTAGWGADWCIITNSRGSGSPEFIAYAPSMDLSPYATNGNLFWGNFKIGATGAADEEIYLTRRVGTTTTVPEPGILALLGLGFMGLGLSRLRGRRA